MWLYGNAVRQTLAKLKNEGLIEKAGVSVYEVSEAERMLNAGIYEAIQIPMNIFDLRMAHSGILEKLKNSGTLVFVRSVFLQGLFFLNPDTLPEGFKSARKYLKKLNTIAKEADISIAQLAISYIRDLDGVSSLVLGAETPEQINDNINLINSPKLDSEVSAMVEKLSEEVPISTIMQEIRKKKV
jgi:aryl-alcohol dehydrogenase-like predicted oxidoreductase